MQMCATMDTPPNFFGEAAAGLDASAMVGDGSFIEESANTADLSSQYTANLGAFGTSAPSETDPWAAPSAPISTRGPPPSPSASDIKVLPRRRPESTTITKSTAPRPRVSMSSSLTGSKSSRSSSDASARTRKSLSSQSTVPDEPETRQGKTGKKTLQDTTPEPNEEGKRSKFLERNRVAASKCRQRKKEWMAGLQETKTELEARHQQLQLEHSALINEVSSMKNQLMTHANCDDPNINLWIENEARRFVQSEAGRVSISQVMQGHVAPKMPRPAMRLSFDGSTPGASPLALDPSMTRIPLKMDGGDEINYDHIPDIIFQESIRDLEG